MTAPRPRIGDWRLCPDCGEPERYTGVEAGWVHDVQVCERKAGAS